jgi:hypothetical protein
MAIAYERAKTLNECSQADLDGSPLKLWEQIRAMEDELKIARGRHNTASTARDILVKEDQQHRRKFADILGAIAPEPHWNDIFKWVEDELKSANAITYQAEEVRAKLGDVRKERDEWKQSAERRLRLASAFQNERDQWRKKAEEGRTEAQPGSSLVMRKMLETKVEIQQAEINELNKKLRIAQGSAGQLAAKVENQRKEITRLLDEKASRNNTILHRGNLVREYARQVPECKRNVNDYYSKLERVRRYAEEDLKDIRVSHIGESILDILDD